MSRDIFSYAQVNNNLLLTFKVGTKVGASI